jgi:hypothetical protein
MIRRSVMIAVLTVLVAASTAILVMGCASLDEKKDAAAGAESGQESSQTTAAVSGAGGSKAKALPVASTAGSPRNATAQQGGSKASGAASSRGKAGGDAGSTPRTPLLKNGVAGLLPKGLLEIDWDRAVPVVGGIIVLSLVWGGAFALARLPGRRRLAARRRSELRAEPVEGTRGPASRRSAAA